MVSINTPGPQTCCWLVYAQPQVVRRPYPTVDVAYFVKKDIFVLFTPFVAFVSHFYLGVEFLILQSQIRAFFLRAVCLFIYHKTILKTDVSKTT